MTVFKLVPFSFFFTAKLLLLQILILQAKLISQLILYGYYYYYLHERPLLLFFFFFVIILTQIKHYFQAVHFFKQQCNKIDDLACTLRLFVCLFNKRANAYVQHKIFILCNRINFTYIRSILL